MFFFRTGQVMRLVIIPVLCIFAVYSYASLKRIEDWSSKANEWEQLVGIAGELNSTVCARKPQVPYLLKSKWFPMPTDSVFDKCEAAGVEYIFASEFEKRLRPQFFMDVLRGNTQNYSVINSTDYYILLKLNKTNQ